MTDVQLQERELEFSPEALEVIGKMRERVRQVGEAFGFHSTEYIEILESFNGALLSLIHLGGRITKDGELSLFGLSFIAYGVIFHRKHRDGKPLDLLGSWSCHS